MKIVLSFAELHAPLFLAGKNFGMKLDGHKHHGIVLTYDREFKELWVTWKDTSGKSHDAIIPLSNVASMTPFREAPETAKEKLAKATTAPKADQPFGYDPAKYKTTAQVSTPQSHVHAGPGHGDTGQDRAKKVVL